MRTDHAIWIGLLILAGCAHSPSRPYPLSESRQQQLGEIGVVARPVNREDALRLPQSGRLADIGRGALFGFEEGIFYAVLSTALSPHPLSPLVGIGITVSVVERAFYGGIMWENWGEAETTLRTVVAELDRDLPDHLVAFSRSHGYEITPLRAGPHEAPEDRSRAALTPRDGVDTLVEIRDLTIGLYPAEFPVNPRRRLGISAQVRLIRTADETVLDDRVLSDAFGPALSFEEWTADQGARFGEEVRHASDRIAERIVTDYFMLSPFPERVFGDGVYDVYLRGLRPYEPSEHMRAPDPIPPRLPLEFRVAAQQVDSLQPTMRWEAFDGADVTYDLEIWRSNDLGIDALIYSRTNLEEPTHTLETALEPSSAYFWSVRAHYSEDGRDRITAWSRRTLKFGLPFKILMGVMTLGIGAIPPAVLYDTFYVFTTPSAPQSPEPAASP